MEDNTGGNLGKVHFLSPCTSSYMYPFMGFTVVFHGGNIQGYNLDSL